MDYITLYIFYGSHTDSFTLSRNTTWSDLCTSIQDRSGIPVTLLYHRNDNGNIQALSCDGDLKSLVYGCNSSWLQLSIDSTMPLVDRLTTQQDGLGTTPIQNDTSSGLEKTYFTTQFESFGKLMDKYNDLIQSDDNIKTMMHQMALRLTLHQKPSVDLAEIEAWLEKRLGNATAGTNGRRSAIDDHSSAHGRVSLALYENHTPGLSRSTTLPSAITTVPSPLYNHVKRTPTAPSYSTYNKYIDQPPTASSSSYKPRQTVKGTILGEWPAYSSLYPPPQSTQVTMNDPSSPPLSLLDSNIHHDHQKSPLSLYPQPPTMETTQSDRTSRSVPNSVPSSSSPSLSPETLSPSAMKPNAISNRSSPSYNNNNDNSKHLAWYDDDDDDDRNKTDDDPWKSSQKRQSYKEQHRVLKSQQKELERTIRHLKRQEKLEKKEYRKKLQQHHDQEDNVSNNNNNAIRKSSSLSSLSSSTSSIYSASSALNDSCLQHQNHRLESTFYFPTTIPSSSTERPYRNIIGRVDDQHHHYGLDSDSHHRFGIDKTSHDNGGGMTFLADTLDRLSMNENTGLHSHGSVV